METTLQPAKRSRIYGIIVILAWMLLAFIAGVSVGMHPDWIPNMPWAYNPLNDLPSDPKTNPAATQPSADISAQTPQTQPSPVVP
jgi:hypothetical protein